MKRKIRKKRQIRLQDFKTQKVRNKLHDDALEERAIVEGMLDKRLSQHPFYKYSDTSSFIFLYVDMHSGMEICKPVKVVFLYDQLSHRIDYGMIEKTGYQYVKEEISFEKMMNCEPKNLADVYDSSYYVLYIKSGTAKRYLHVLSDNVPLYTPFSWLFRLFHSILEETAVINRAKGENKV